MVVEHGGHWLDEVNAASGVGGVDNVPAEEPAATPRALAPLALRQRGPCSGCRGGQAALDRLGLASPLKDYLSPSNHFAN